MQEHAVPQDITGFKFKLIGDMTVKQFVELASGAVVAYLFYASAFYAVIKWPMVLISALFGVALAFLPIQERPLDVWIINFFRAIYRPTYFVWKKDLSARVVGENDFRPAYLNYTSSTPSASTVPVSTPTPTLATASTFVAPAATKDANEKKTEEEKPNEPVKEETKTDSQPTPEAEKAPATTPVVPEPTKAGDSTSVEDLMKVREQILDQQKNGVTSVAGQNTTSTATPASIPTEPNMMTVDQLVNLREQKKQQTDQDQNQMLVASQQKIDQLSGQLKDLLIKIEQMQKGVSENTQGPNQQAEIDRLTQQKTEVSSQISQLRKQASDQRVSSVAFSEYKEPIKAAAKVRVVKKTVNEPATVKLTDLPNVINGSVVDLADKPIDGVILIIKDKDGNSIRAFKTNKVGQFIVSTPMQNGTYVLELEKNGFVFDTLEVTLEGSILEPLTIKAKQTA